jgi:hypothetical protein
MKIVFYGASVTAQKGATGYFECLENIKPEIAELVRIPYGASHLHFAGIAMLQKVIDEEPDFCILDWITPSSKTFPEGTVNRVNNILLSHGIRPIWVLLPRSDDPNSDRECCKQLRASESAVVDVVEFQKSEFCEPDLTKILRDVVHTNALGAERYSKFFLSIIKNYIGRDELKLEKSTHPVNAPLVTECDGVLDNDSNLNLEILVTENSDISLFIFCKVGPLSPVLDIRLVDKKGKEERLTKNVVDPWCYYERDMLLNLPKFKKVSKGLYLITISIRDIDPFETVTTLKPIKEEFNLKSNLERFLKLKEISLDGSVTLRNINYGV